MTFSDDEDLVRDVLEAMVVESEHGERPSETLLRLISERNQARRQEQRLRRRTHRLERLLAAVIAAHPAQTIRLRRDALLHVPPGRLQKRTDVRTGEQILTVRE